MQFRSLAASPDSASTGAERRPHIDAFDMHPLDYALVQQAAAIQGIPLADFVALSAYRTACQVVEEESAALFPAVHTRKRRQPPVLPMSIFALKKIS